MPTTLPVALASVLRHSGTLVIGALMAILHLKGDKQEWLDDGLLLVPFASVVLWSVAGRLKLTGFVTQVLQAYGMGK